MTVRANSGTMTRGIFDHIKLSLRKKPDITIFLCGTSDLTSQSKAIQNMRELIILLKAEWLDSITRRDKPVLQYKVDELNAEIKTFAATIK